MIESSFPIKDVVENRRQQLRAWIESRFDGSHAAFIASTNDGERQINQGELSGLLRTKSFGEKRARSLETQAHMPAGYLDSRHPQSEPYAAPAQTVLFEAGRGRTAAVSKLSWPFHQVSYGRLMTLKKSLGRDAAAALRDIDDQLDVIVTKWERRVDDKKGRSNGV